MRLNSSVSAMLVCVACSAGAKAQQYSYTVLASVIPGTSARAAALGVSGNGQVIVGGDTRAVEGGEQAFIWRKNGNIWVRSQLPLPTGSEPVPQNVGRAICASFDGDIVGGMCGGNGAVFSTNYGMAAIWTGVLSGQPELLWFNEDRASGLCTGVSAEGKPSMIFRVRPNFQYEILSWSGDLIVPLSIPRDFYFPNSTGFYGTQHLSPDGTTFVFHARLTGNDYDAIKSVNNVVQRLDRIDGQLPSARSYFTCAASSGGQVVTGFAAANTTNVGFKRAVWWDGDGHCHVLPAPANVGLSFDSMATSVSADGKVIGGSQFNGYMPFWAAVSTITTEAHATVWINGTPQRLVDLLRSQGVGTSSTIPAMITGISHDGSTLVGIARGDNGQFGTMVSFVATIRPPDVCDDIDFNRDNSRFDPMDIDAFLSVFSEGPCLPAGRQCRDIDFNNDGSLFDPRDIEAFLSVFSEGPCL